MSTDYNEQLERVYSARADAMRLADLLDETSELDKWKRYGVIVLPYLITIAAVVVVIVQINDTDGLSLAQVPALIVGLTSAAAGRLGQEQKSALDQASDGREMAKALGEKLDHQVDLWAFVDRVPHALSAITGGIGGVAATQKEGQAIGGLLDAGLTLVKDPNRTRIAYYLFYDDNLMPLPYRQGWRGGPPTNIQRRDQDNTQSSPNDNERSSPGIDVVELLHLNRFLLFESRQLRHLEASRSYPYVAATPVWRGDRPHGVLWVESQQAGMLTVDHEGPLRTVGYLIALIVDMLSPASLVPKDRAGG